MIDFKKTTFVCCLLLLALSALWLARVLSPQHSESVCTYQAQKSDVRICDVTLLRIYYPYYSKIDHVCGTMPSPDDPDVVFCCAAAFTGQLLDSFRHSNVAGNHVCGGVFHNGYTCKANTGCFVYYADDGSWEFAVDNHNTYLKQAAGRGGCGFGQSMLIHNGVQLTDRGPLRKSTSCNSYRVLAEYNGQLCIIDSRESISIEQFIRELVSIGVKHALYLDMGGDWNFSFYRDNSGQVSYIHDKRSKYSTNWLTFYK